MNNRNYAQAHNAMGLIYADANVLYRLIEEDYFTKDMVFQVVGKTMGSVADRIDELLQVPESKNRVQNTIEVRPEAHALLIEMRDRWAAVVDEIKAKQETRDG